MTTVTWCTFLPLLTAGILILVPAGWKWLIKTLSLLGAVGTFIIAIGLVRGYSVEVDDARTTLSQVQESVIASATWGPGASYSGPEGILRWKTEFLAPVVDATGASRIPRPTAWDGWSPAARDAWEEATELHLAMGVKQAEHIRFVEYVPWIPAFKINYFVGVD